MMISPVFIIVTWFHPLIIRLLLVKSWREETGMKEVLSISLFLSAPSPHLLPDDYSISWDLTSPYSCSVCISPRIFLSLLAEVFYYSFSWRKIHPSIFQEREREKKRKVFYGEEERQEKHFFSSCRFESTSPDPLQVLHSNQRFSIGTNGLLLCASFLSFTSSDASSTPIHLWRENSWMFLMLKMMTMILMLKTNGGFWSINFTFIPPISSPISPFLFFCQVFSRRIIIMMLIRSGVLPSLLLNDSLLVLFFFSDRIFQMVWEKNGTSERRKEKTTVHNCS